MNVKFKASARTTTLHLTGAGRQRNPTAPVGGEVFSLDIPFHRTHYERVPLFGYVLVSDKTFPLREERSTLWTTLSISVWMCTRPLPRLPFRTAEVGSSWKRPWRPKPQP